jgi:hypothetical protein
MTFAAHIEAVNAIAQSGPSGLAAVIRFALLTIRTQFESIQTLAADYLNNGNESKQLWGFKRRAFAYVEAHQDELFASATDALQVSDAALIEVFTDVPGLGLAKAGFVAQLFANRVGCLDYLNVKRYGVDPKDVSLPKTLKPASKRKRINAYVVLCADIGSSSALWGTWCDMVGERKAWPNGSAVSRTHVNVVKALV